MKELKTDFCKGCKWSFDHDICPNNEIDENVLFNKDGSYQMIYCQWYSKDSKIKIRKMFTKLNKKGELNED